MAVYCDHCGQAVDCDICKNPFCKLNQSDICQSESCCGCKDAIECAESYRVKLIAARKALAESGEILDRWHSARMNISQAQLNLLFDESIQARANIEKIFKP